MCCFLVITSVGLISPFFLYQSGVYNEDFIFVDTGRILAIEDVFVFDTICVSKSS